MTRELRCHDMYNKFNLNIYFGPNDNYHRIFTKVIEELKYISRRIVNKQANKQKPRTNLNGEPPFFTIIQYFLIKTHLIYKQKL